MVKNLGKIGKIGEEQAAELLLNGGYTIIAQGDTFSAYDILAEKDGRYYAISVKIGKASFGTSKRNLERLSEYAEKGYIPALMFLMEPWCEYLLFSLEKFGWRRNESRIFDEHAEKYNEEEAEKRRKDIRIGPSKTSSFVASSKKHFQLLAKMLEEANIPLRDSLDSREAA